jgi:hypothetical protein
MEDVFKYLAPYIYVGIGVLAGVGGKATYDRQHEKQKSSNVDIAPQIEFIKTTVQEIKESVKENKSSNEKTFDIVFENIREIESNLSKLGKEVGVLQGEHNR